VEHREAEHREAPDQVDHQDIRLADHQEVQDSGSSDQLVRFFWIKQLPEHQEKCRIKWCATGIRFGDHQDQVVEVVHQAHQAQSGNIRSRQGGSSD
jgi:hypothetical protein